MNHQSKHNLHSLSEVLATYFGLNQSNRPLYKTDSRYNVMTRQYTALSLCSCMGSHVTIIITVQL